MVTDRKQLIALESRLAEMAPSADVILPASFIDGLVRDLRDAQAASRALDALKVRVDDLEARGPSVVLVAGGEEDS